MIKHLVYWFIIFLICFITGLNKLAAQGSIPELNKSIIEYVGSVIGEKVDRGEC